MSALDKIPSNNNFLSPLGFHFSVRKLPSVNFFVQKVRIPSITLPSADTPNPFIKIPYSGDHLNFSDLQIEFKLDENMTNYFELYKWFAGLGFPEDHSQYKKQSEYNEPLNDGLISDISIIVLTSLKNANIEFIFKDAWPTYISDFTMNTTDESVNYISVTAIFKFLSFEPVIINK